MTSTQRPVSGREEATVLLITFTMVGLVIFSKWIARESFHSAGCCDTPSVCNTMPSGFSMASETMAMLSMVSATKALIRLRVVAAPSSAVLVTVVGGVDELAAVELAAAADDAAAAAAGFGLLAWVIASSRSLLEMAAGAWGIVAVGTAAAAAALVPCAGTAEAIGAVGAAAAAAGPATGPAADATVATGAAAAVGAVGVILVLFASPAGAAPAALTGGGWLIGFGGAAAAAGCGGSVGFGKGPRAMGSWSVLATGGLPLVGGPVRQGCHSICVKRAWSHLSLSTLRFNALLRTMPLGVPMKCSSVRSSLPSQIPSNQALSNLLTTAPGRLHITPSPGRRSARW